MPSTVRGIIYWDEVVCAVPIGCGVPPSADELLLESAPTPMPGFCLMKMLHPSGTRE
jgi:hypothetical protein